MACSGTSQLWCLIARSLLQLWAFRERASQLRLLTSWPRTCFEASRTRRRRCIRYDRNQSSETESTRRNRLVWYYHSRRVAMEQTLVHAVTRRSFVCCVSNQGKREHWLVDSLVSDRDTSLPAKLQHIAQRILAAARERAPWLLVANALSGSASSLGVYLVKNVVLWCCWHASPVYEPNPLRGTCPLLQRKRGSTGWGQPSRSTSRCGSVQRICSRPGADTAAVASCCRSQVTEFTPEWYRADDRMILFLPIRWHGYSTSVL